MTFVFVTGLLASMLSIALLCAFVSTICPLAMIVFRVAELVPLTDVLVNLATTYVTDGLDSADMDFM